MAAHNSGQKVEPIDENPDAEQKQESVREKSSINDNAKSLKETKAEEKVANKKDDD